MSDERMSDDFDPEQDRSNVMAWGIGPAMFLIMFALKLSGPMAAVSWWWITCPLWIPLVMFIAFFAITLAMAAFKETRK